MDSYSTSSYQSNRDPRDNRQVSAAPNSYPLLPPLLKLSGVAVVPPTLLALPLNSILYSGLWCTVTEGQSVIIRRRVVSSAV